MRNGWFDPDDLFRRLEEWQKTPAGERLIPVGLIAAGSLAVASTAPPTLVPAIFAQLTLSAALVLAVAAGLRGEGATDDRVTGWDQAAILLLLGLIADLMVDAEAVGESLAALGAG